jgi:outer membrane protein assembly factor BamB
MGFGQDVNRLSIQKERKSLRKRVLIRLRVLARVGCPYRFRRGLAALPLGLSIGLVALLAIQAASGQSTKKAGEVDERGKKGAPTPAESVAEGGATSKSLLALPFKSSWLYLTKSTILLAPTVDGGRIYQPLQEGRIVCLDRQSGSLLWSSDSGGRVTAPIATAEYEAGTVIFVASEKLADGAGSSSGLLRALDPATGVALWARDYPRPFKSPILTGRGRLYVGSSDGSLYAISSTDGVVVWKVQTQDVVTASALVTNKAIYFGSDDGALRAVSPETGQELWKYQTTGRIVCLPAIDDRHIYFGSGDGWIYSLDLLDGRLKWKSRTGAAVEASPVIAGDRLVVGSLDNFIYAISRSNGDRLWKRRLDNRIVFPAIVDGDAVMVAPLRGDHVPVFLISDGRRLNYYRLSRNSEIVASPSFVDGTLLVPTDRGLLAAVAITPARSEEESKGSKEQMSGDLAKPERAKKPNPPSPRLP